MVPILRPWARAKSIRSSSRAMVPSSRMISQITPLGIEPGEPRDVDRGFGMAGADQDAAGPRDQRKDMARGNDRFGIVGGIDRHRDGARAVGGADPGRNPLLGLDRHREGGLVAAAVGPRHRLEPELVGAVLAEREADEAAPVARHEIDRVRGRHLGRNDEVALILAALVVDEDEHAAVARLVDDRFGPDQHFGGAALNQLLEARQRVGGRVPVGGAQFAQTIGVKARGPRKAGAADFPGGDDRFELFDEVRGHDRHISHCSVMKSRYRPVPTVIARRASARYSAPARQPRH